MAPCKPDKHGKGQKKKIANRTPEKLRPAKTILDINVRQLLVEATAKLSQGDTEGAQRVAQNIYNHTSCKGRHAGALCVLLGQVAVELGNMEGARAWFEKAVQAYAKKVPDGIPFEQDEEDLVAGGAGVAEPFLWLAQLSEEGGADSVKWYEKGAASLRKQLTALDRMLERARPGLPNLTQRLEAAGEHKKRRLAETLCAMAEVYMTDLSWETDAETRCEALVTEATMLAPDLAEAWQTVASVRVSQERMEEARVALERSMEGWAHVDLVAVGEVQGEDEAEGKIPSFATRVSLLRLLIEVEMEEKAVGVAERLVLEDDRSVEVWYLGGFASYKMGERLKNSVADDTKGTAIAKDEVSWAEAWFTARRWLAQCLKLFREEDYEDERLGQHASELLLAIQKGLGDAPADGDGGDDWEDPDEDGDEDMS